MFYPKISNGDDLETACPGPHLDHEYPSFRPDSSNLPLKMDSNMVHLLFITLTLSFPPVSFTQGFLSLSLSLIYSTLRLINPR